VFIATSLDGFIAREDGEIDWLPSGEEGSEGDDHGYSTFIAGVDALVMGRHTYEKVLSFGFWPYEELPVVVLTSVAADSLPRPAPTVKFMNGAPREVVESLGARGLHHLYVDGGITIRSFLEAGLIGRIILTRVPVLLGSGIPLFGPIGRDIHLRHLQTRAFPNGLVQSEYEVVS
jgi:dihydrofolate reductase